MLYVPQHTCPHRTRHSAQQPRGEPDAPPPQRWPGAVGPVQEVVQEPCYRIDEVHEVAQAEVQVFQEVEWVPPTRGMGPPLPILPQLDSSSNVADFRVKISFVCYLHNTKFP